MINNYLIKKKGGDFLMNLMNFGAMESYKKISRLGDRLIKVNVAINWEAFRPIIRKAYYDNQAGGRPHTDEVIIIKCLMLQSWYGLSDPELEFQINDRISFKNFLGYPETMPDFTTIWKARERLQKKGLDKKIWKQLQNQLENKGFTIKKGVMQDATFIESDTGKKRMHYEKKAKKKGEKIDYTEKQLNHIDKDATFTIKNGQVHYGYKNHIKMDVKHQLIRDYEVTTASTHDSKINLITKNDKKAYLDKGYTGMKLSKKIINMTMKRAARNHPLTEKQETQNKKISKIRNRVERPFSVIKRTMHNIINKTTTLARVKIKTMFQNFAYNTYQLITLLARAI